MPRKWSKAVPEGNGPVPDDEVGSGQPTIADLYRIIKERSEESDRKLEGRAYGDGETGEPAFSRTVAWSSVATYRHGGRRKIRHQNSQSYGERCSGDSFSAHLDPNPMCVTSFGDDSTKSLALPF